MHRHPQEHRDEERRHPREGEGEAAHARPSPPAITQRAARATL